MGVARLARGTYKPRILTLSEPQSNFDLVDQLFTREGLTRRLESIRRLFSLARASKCNTLVIESISAEGSILNENLDLLSRFPDYKMNELWRISFWNKKFTTIRGLPKKINPLQKLEGFAILKLDFTKSDSDGKIYFAWHIYESVFKKYEYKHNYLPCSKKINVKIATETFSIEGIPFCQQNTLNKACAQVALRSLLLGRIGFDDICYSEIHTAAKGISTDFNPGKGLTIEQIQNTLKYFKIEYEDIDYNKELDPQINKAANIIQKFVSAKKAPLTQEEIAFLKSRIRTTISDQTKDHITQILESAIPLGRDFVSLIFPWLNESNISKLLSQLSEIQIQPNKHLTNQQLLTSLQKELPYQRFLYAGIESGGGALLGFDLSMTEETAGGRHIVPVIGHTFNKDTWVPKAVENYFKVGKDTQYVSSDNWLSSFIMHDDNFGPNFCLPKSFVNPTQVSYVTSILRAGAKYGALTAEAIGINFMYALGNAVLLDPKSDWFNQWHARLSKSIEREEVVLRAVCVSAKEYSNSLQNSRDWRGQSEDPNMPDLLEKHLPPLLWQIEFSIPELFPANHRKIGELLLDATRKPDLKMKTDYSVFTLARFPGVYLLRLKENFALYKSNMIDHTPLFRFQ